MTRKRAAECGHEANERERKDAEGKAQRREEESCSESAKRKEANAERELKRRGKENEVELANRSAAYAERTEKRRLEGSKGKYAKRRAADVIRQFNRRHQTCATKYAALKPLDEDEIDYHYLERMDQVYRFCRAKFFAAEKTQGSTYSSVVMAKGFRHRPFLMCQVSVCESNKEKLKKVCRKFLM
jgi:hypothetical protein